MMKWIVVLLLALSFIGPASAESCSKSREYILEGFAGDLPEPAARYQDLFKICVIALTLANVKDAYILKDGGIAIIPTRNTVVDTAETLAQFCQRFPRSVARFLTPREQKADPAVGLIVMLASTDATSCKKIRGMM